MNYIKDYRKQLWYRQSDVSDYLWISRPTYTQIENWVRNAKRREIIALCELFIIREEDLYIKPKIKTMEYWKIAKKRRDFINIWKELIKLWYKDLKDDIYDIEFWK